MRCLRGGRSVTEAHGIGGSGPEVGKYVVWSLRGWGSVLRVVVCDGRPHNRTGSPACCCCGSKGGGK